MGHGYMGHDYIGHNYMGRSYEGHNYIGHNVRFGRGLEFVDRSLCRLQLSERLKAITI